MPQLPTNNIWTIHDSVSLQQPNGKMVRYIINLLAELTPVYRNGRFQKANYGTYHSNTFRTASTGAGKTAPNQGHEQNKGTWATVRDTMGMYSNISTVDERTVGPFQSLGEVRRQNANVIIEDIARAFETDFFYGSIADDPRGFDGLASRFNSLPTASNPLSRQVVDAGGRSGDNTSIYFVTWGETQSGLIYPPNKPAGIERKDEGRQRVTDRDGKPYYAWEEVISLDAGVTVGDYTFSGRIANIDVSAAKAGDLNLFTPLQELFFERVKGHYNSRLNDSDKQSVGKQVIYMNRQMVSALVTQSRNAGSSDNAVRLQPIQLEGREYQSYMGIPIEVTDALLNTEAVVS